MSSDFFQVKCLQLVLTFTVFKKCYSALHSLRWSLKPILEFSVKLKCQKKINQNNNEERGDIICH